MAQPTYSVETIEGNQIRITTTVDNGNGNEQIAKRLVNKLSELVNIDDRIAGINNQITTMQNEITALEALKSAIEAL